MRIVLWPAWAAAALLLGGCITMDNLTLESVAIGGYEPDPNGRYGSFSCDNGYSVFIKYLSPIRISLSFNNGKDRFIDYLDGQADAGGGYANRLNNLRWQETNSAGVLTYPAGDWRTSRRLLTTACTPRSRHP
ncbi:MULTISPECIES: hypothetical protein [unclassified Neisseria]|uniref:hypothetical protein n=1 Tax=unclassified Neisseria TaxID=2623750 RepID=UPI002666B292|nr:MULTISPECIES: hypothetical protein [unclassified Neisseria]MDO1508844.1 hypothetical protein [Neisseria sp. MVDL19-042950]MDO1515103.1 hypothetical protein [Neisseria sp. MVDL18-041461]MDO1562463.1 hypothetical protein [Neisseria sp. MVDL20-010259]